MELSLQVN